MYTAFTQIGVLAPFDVPTLFMSSNHSAKWNCVHDKFSYLVKTMTLMQGWQVFAERWKKPS